MSTTIEHTHFVPVKDAALRVGYSSDYVARLAREGKVLSKREGRQWTVELDSLKLFLLEIEAVKRARQEELRRERRAELVARQYRDITHRDVTPDIEQGTPSAFAGAAVFATAIMLCSMLAWQSVSSGLTTTSLRAGMTEVSGVMQGAFTLGSLPHIVLDVFQVWHIAPQLLHEKHQAYTCDANVDPDVGVFGCILTTDAEDVTLADVSTSDVQNLFSDPVSVRFFDARSGTITPQFRNSGTSSYRFNVVASHATVIDP